MQLSFFVAGNPVPKGSFRAFNNGGRPVITNNNPKTKDWEMRIAHEAQANIGDWPPNFDGPVSIAIAFVFPRPKSLKKSEFFHIKRPDLDKLIRASLDGITGILIKDDSQVWHIESDKSYECDDIQPGVYIHLSINERP